MYEVGQRVVSLVDAQGLVLGAEYEVVAVYNTRNFLGGYTTYDLRRTGEISETFFRVGNGHLVLKEAP